METNSTLPEVKPQEVDQNSPKFGDSSSKMVITINSDFNTIYENLTSPENPILNTYTSLVVVIPRHTKKQLLDNALLQICDLIGSLQKLNSLTIEYDNWSKVWLKKSTFNKLCDTLVTLNTLVSLVLRFKGCSGIYDEDLTKLSMTIKELKQLTSLELDFRLIYDHEESHFFGGARGNLVEAICKLSSLKHLTLNFSGHQNINDDAFKRLYVKTTELPNLKTLKWDCSLSHMIHKAEAVEETTKTKEKDKAKKQKENKDFNSPIFGFLCCTRREADPDKPKTKPPEPLPSAGLSIRQPIQLVSIIDQVDSIINCYNGYCDKAEKLGEKYTTLKQAFTANVILEGAEGGYLMTDKEIREVTNELSKVAHLPTSMQQNRKLKEQGVETSLAISNLFLHYRQNKDFTDKALSYIVGMINDFPTLTTLYIDLEYNENFTDRGFDHLSKSFYRLKELTTLHLNFRWSRLFTDSVLDDLSSSLQRLPALVDFYCNFNEIACFSSYAFDNFATALSLLSNLSKLDLNFASTKSLHDKGCDALGKSLIKLPDLTKLRLNLHNNTEITDVGLEYLAEAIGKLSNLTCLYLDFYGNPNFSDAGLETLALNIGKLSSLSELYLDFHCNEKFKDNGLNKLTSSLHSLTDLSSVEIDFLCAKLFTKEGTEDSYNKLEKLGMLNLKFSRSIKKQKPAS
jgi:hypothetical protein